ELLARAQPGRSACRTGLPRQPLLNCRAEGSRMDEGSKLLSTQMPPSATRPAIRTLGRVFMTAPSRLAKADNARSPDSQSSLMALYKTQTMTPATRTNTICFQIGQLCHGAPITFVI